MTKTMRATFTTVTNPAPAKAQPAKIATLAVLHQRLADHRIARYPEMYRGFEDDALYFARKQYPTKADAILACEVNGISREAGQ